MRLRSSLFLCLAATCACGDAEGPSAARPRAARPSAARPSAAPSALTGAGTCPGGELTEIAPLIVDDGTAADPTANDAPRFARFVDPASGCVTDRVHDADREIVFFDGALAAMVSLDSGNAVSGWSVDGAELDWSRSGVRFRVRFGTEDGERRAYFTETGPGTICNLNLAGPDMLFISATSETPPSP